AGTICRSESLKSFLTGLTASRDRSAWAVFKGLGLPAGRLAVGLLPRRNQFVGAAFAFAHAKAGVFGALALSGAIPGSGDSACATRAGVATLALNTCVSAASSDLRCGASDTVRPIGANLGKSPCSAIL